MQGAHHVAQKSSTTACPLRSAQVSDSPSSVLNWSAGGRSPGFSSAYGSPPHAAGEATTHSTHSIRFHRMAHLRAHVMPAEGERLALARDRRASGCSSTETGTARGGTITGGYKRCRRGLIDVDAVYENGVPKLLRVGSFPLALSEKTRVRVTSRSRPRRRRLVWSDDDPHTAGTPQRSPDRGSVKSRLSGVTSPRSTTTPQRPARLISSTPASSSRCSCGGRPITTASQEVFEGFRGQRLQDRLHHETDRRNRHAAAEEGIPCRAVGLAVLNAPRRRLWAA